MDPVKACVLFGDELCLSNCRIERLIIHDRPVFHSAPSILAPSILAERRAVGGVARAGVSRMLREGITGLSDPLQKNFFTFSFLT